MSIDPQTRQSLKEQSRQHFRVAVHGSGEGYVLSLKPKPDIIDYARKKFDALSEHASVEQNQVHVRSIHIAIFALKRMHGLIHDMWILDPTWDTDPLKGRSNAEMTGEVFKRAGIKDKAEIYSSQGLSGFDAPENSRKTTGLLGGAVSLGPAGP